MKKQTRSLTVGRRADGTSWQIPLVEMDGGAPGPTTAFVMGLLGGQSLTSVVAHRLIDRLGHDELSFAGKVYVLPIANPYGFEAGDRVNPDHIHLNRSFPGSPTGFLTHQIADLIYSTLLDSVDCVVDVHSGTTTASLAYTYNYGDLALSSSFGYLPVVEHHPIEGQLGMAFSNAGRSALLPQFGGGLASDPDLGVEGCLNVLRYRGHLDGELTGPRTVPLVRDIDFGVVSKTGILVSDFDSRRLGEEVPDGVFAWVVDPTSGARIEEFAPRREHSVVLGARVTPVHVSPGDFVYAFGQVERHITVGVG